MEQREREEKGKRGRGKKGANRGEGGGY